jgi:hypothetical protein
MREQFFSVLKVHSTAEDSLLEPEDMPCHGDKMHEIWIKMNLGLFLDMVLVCA